MVASGEKSLLRLWHIPHIFASRAKHEAEGWKMNDPVFLDSAAFLRVWQRVTGEAGSTAAPVQPEPDAITAQLRECICAKAAGAAF